MPGPPEGEPDSIGPHVPNRRPVNRTRDRELTQPVDPKLILKFGAKQIISLFIPVSICMFAVATIAKSVPYFASTDVYLIYTPFNTPNADTGTQVWQTLANVAIFLCIVIVMTFVLVLLFKYKCYKCLGCWLVATTFLLVFVISFIFFTEVLRASMIFFDNITFSILLWNFGVMGLISIHWKSPLIVQQAYLIFNSVQLALIFLKFLPKWTCWVLLGALAIWDLIAVLCPRGPLRMLVEMAQERDRPLLPAMIYSTTTAYIAVTRRPVPSAEPPTDVVDSCARITTPSHRGETSPLLKLSTATLPVSPISDPYPEATSRNGSIATGLRRRTPQTIPTTTLGNVSGGGSGGGEVPDRHPDSPPKSPPPLATGPDDRGSYEMTPDGVAAAAGLPTTLPIDTHATTGTGSAGGEGVPEGGDDRLRCLQEDLHDREEHGVKLGLGDFIFYSLLIGRAALDGDMLTIVACYIAILVGMCMTIIALGIARKALPALPISIACGIVFYFSTAAVITPFIKATSEKRLYF